MERYRYSATNSAGQTVTGELEARDFQAASQALAAQELTVTSLTPLRVAASPLSTAESEELAGHVSRVSASQLPLAAGLRAAAAECGSRPIAQALEKLAAQVEQGQSLEDAVTSHSGMFTASIGGLIVAAGRTGKLGIALTELLDHQRKTRTLRYFIWRGLAYPIFVGAFAAIILSVATFFVSGVYERMFVDFGLQLPIVTRLLFWWRDYGVLWLAGVLLGGWALSALLRQSLGAARWSRFTASVPIVGPLNFWSAIAEWCGLLSVLTRFDIPLPEALRLSGASVRNAYLSHVVMSLAHSADQGRSLSDCLSSDRRIPVSLLPLIRWGERVGLLHEAFATGRELFERRVQVRSLLLRSVLPPIMFLLIASCALLLVMALFMPLFSLLQALS